MGVTSETEPTATPADHRRLPFWPACRADGPINQSREARPLGSSAILADLRSAPPSAAV
jgi:hypothetical protein